MRIGDRRVRAGLTIGLLILIALAAYPIGRHLWGEYHRQALDAALAARDFDKAERELEKCLAAWPGRADLVLISAQLARRQGKLAEAAWRLKQCPRDQSVQEQIVLEECLLAIQRGEFADSDQLDEYCASFPDSRESLLIEEAQIVGSLAALDVPRARQYLKVFSERRKSPADRLQGLLWESTAALLARDVDEAARRFREAVELAPENREARLGLAQILADSDPPEAAEHLQQIQEQGIVDAEVQLCQAVVARNLGQADEAKRLLDEITASDTENVSAIVLRGRLALDEREFDEAGQWFRRAEAVEPKHRDVLAALVEYYRLTGQTAEAQVYQNRMDELKSAVIQHVESVLKERNRGAAGKGEQPDAAK